MTHLNEVNKLKSGKVSEPRLPVAHSLPLRVWALYARGKLVQPPRSVSDGSQPPSPARGSDAAHRIRQQTVNATHVKSCGVLEGGVLWRKQSRVRGFVAENPSKKVSFCIKLKSYEIGVRRWEVQKQEEEEEET